MLNITVKNGVIIIVKNRSRQLVSKWVRIIQRKKCLKCKKNGKYKFVDIIYFSIKNTIYYKQ